MESEVKKTKYKITIHESAVSGNELVNFLKGIGNVEYTFTSALPFTQESLVTIYKKLGTQIDDIKAKLRMANVIPQIQDYVLFGPLEYKLAIDYSKRFPDANVYLVPSDGETKDDFPDMGNVKIVSWQLFHEYIANKTDSRSKFQSKAEKSVKPKKVSNYGKTNTNQSQRKDTEETNRKNRPTEVNDEHEPESEGWGEEGDARYD